VIVKDIIPQNKWKGWLHINPKFHHEYIEIESQELGRDIWHKSMFNNPCKCCGSKEHALLKISGGDIVQIDFECPVICHEKVQDMLREECKEKMYEPCPEKFACSYGYQELVVREALKQLNDDGIGKYWNWSSCVGFNKKVSDSCINHSRQCTFKRDLSIGCFHVEEIEVILEENDSSISA